jgi:hypothetical protein
MMAQAQAGAGEEFMLRPTVLIQMHPDSFNVVTVEAEREAEALVVFRGPEDAAGYQRDSGKHTAEEGFERVGMAAGAIDALLRESGLEWVHLAAPWGTNEPGALFGAESFIWLLEESPTDEQATDQTLGEEERT